MKITSLILAAGLLAVLPLSAQAKIERTVEKSFAVQPGSNLRVSTQGGHITLTAGGGDTIRITARQKIRAENEAEADKILEKLDLAMTQTGDEVVATARYEQRQSGWKFGGWPPVQVDFEITVPESLHADLRTSGGHITVGDLTGNLVVRTSGGHIELGHIRGEVKAGTSGGNVNLEHASGPADLRTSGGHIKVRQLQHSLKASTSGGHVTAALTGPLQGDCLLSTSGGHVKVTVHPAAAFRLDAATSGGKVNAAGLTVALTATSRTRLAGNVNGGGPLLKLRTSGGNITIATAAGTN
jgi:uncharacterized protein involved in outer membrane biogenesis